MANAEHETRSLGVARAGRPGRAGRPRRSALLTAGVVLVGLAAGLSLAWLLLGGRAVHCDADRSGGCIRVLFVGNSYTYVNDLPGTFAALAASGGHPVETSMIASGGATLADHLASAATMAMIRGSHWDFVILQEQSGIPASALAQRQQMEPAARGLLTAVQAASGQPVLFETWAHRDGYPEIGLTGYEAMQAQVNLAYESIGADLQVPVARVGRAWEAVARFEPDLPLWSEDGIHPAPAGTYLAACVFYVTVFGGSPEGVAYRGDLPAATVLELQRVAASAMLTAP
jgi:hypothetical protein